MKNKLTSHLFSFASVLLILPLSAGLCTKRPATCHQTIKVVNNSENTIFLGRPGYFPNIIGTEYVEDVGLFDCCEPIPSQDTVVVQVVNRHCLEDYDSCPMSFYILPTPPSGIITTSDSLYIVYDILKTIDLQELGVDSLVKTDYTFFYP